MQPKVAVFGTLRFPPERVAQIRPHLKVLVETTCRNDGCLAYDVAEDQFEPGLLRFSELWPDQETLTQHLKAPHIEPWRRAARECGLLERKFTAYDIAGSRTV
jgi:quinol monooxygenase YgiN